MRDKTEDDSQQTDSFTVSAVYQQIAIEQAPQELDSKILRAATIEARGSGNRTLWWLRPAALAATLALSVALVLQGADRRETLLRMAELRNPLYAETADLRVSASGSGSSAAMARHVGTQIARTWQYLETKTTHD